jgi:translocation and assembly module TamB
VKRLLAPVGALAGGALLTLAAVFYWFALTEAGLQRLVQGAGPWLPGFRVGRVEGVLLGHSRWQNLNYQDALGAIRCAELDLELDPAELWQGALHIRRLAIIGPDYRSTDSSPSQMPALPLPFDLIVDEVRLSQGTVQMAGDTAAYRVDQVLASFAMTHEALTLRRFDLQAPEVSLTASGDLSWLGQRRLEFVTDWVFRPATGPELRGGGFATGTLERVLLQQSLKSPATAELSLVASRQADNYHWTGQLDVAEFVPRQMEPSWINWPLKLSLKGEGFGMEGEWVGNFQTRIPAVGTVNGDLKAGYRQPGELTIHELALTLPATQSVFALTGRVGNLQDSPSFNINAHWQNLLWPPEPKADWRSPEGEVTLRGGLDDLAFEARAKLHNTPVTAAGHIGLQRDQTVFRGLNLQGAGTDLRLDGVLGPQLDLTWQIRAQDLAAWVPLAGGWIDSHGHLEGPRAAPAGSFELSGRGLRYLNDEIKTLQAHFHGSQVAGYTAVSAALNAEGLRIEGSQARAIELSLTAGLSYRDGALQLQGAPLEAMFQARGPAYQGSSARSVSATLKSGVQADAPLAFELKTDGLRWRGSALDVALNGLGTRARHRISGRIRGDAELTLMAEGGLSNERWAGKLGQFDLDLPLWGHWHLNRTVPLQLGKGAAEVGTACWNSEESEVCLQGTYTPTGDWQLSSRVKDFALTRLTRGLPKDLMVKGALNAGGVLSGKALRLGQGRFDVELVSADVQYRRPGKPPLILKPDPVTLRASVNARGADLNLVCEQPGMAHLRTTIGLAGPIDLDRLQQTPITAEAHLDMDAIGQLLPPSHDVDALKGRVKADVRITGTALSPRITAHATLYDAGFDVPQLGIHVRDLQLDAVSRDNNQLALTGRAVSGGGEIGLDGIASLSARAGWPLTLKLSGKRFLAVDNPEAKVLLSPDLVIRHEPDAFSLTGTLAIPEATITIPDEERAIKPSKDTVMVGGAVPAAVENPLATRVAVVLGNKVTVSGPGYKARLDGQLTIEQANGQAPTGTGQIVIRDGRYSLYGVELAIDDGRIIYARSPLDNPTLEISANRTTDDLKAGAKVLGTLSKPSLSLFADRPMSQTDILAFLVSGKSASDTLTQQEGSAMKAAASALGGAAGSLVARELANRLGIGGFVDISMQNSLNQGSLAQGYTGGGAFGGTQGTALFLGKYLTPRIYVQYGMGLFQNAYVFRLRYDLTRHWKVQTETGEYSGGDLLFQWEE